MLKHYTCTAPIHNLKFSLSDPLPIVPTNNASDEATVLVLKNPCISNLVLFTLKHTLPQGFCTDLRSYI